jgi:hypothetical protein
MPVILGKKMTSNIITFTRQASSRLRNPAPTPQDNVISIEAWTRQAHPHRTPAGVFFMTRVLRSSGDAA